MVRLNLMCLNINKRVNTFKKCNEWIGGQGTCIGLLSEFTSKMLLYDNSNINFSDDVAMITSKEIKVIKSVAVRYAVLVSLIETHGSQFWVMAIYNRPLTYESLKKITEVLDQLADEPVIIGGDFNAEMKSWCDNPKDPRPNITENKMQISALELRFLSNNFRPMIPRNTLTRITETSSSMIDCLLCNFSSISLDVVLMDEKTLSDHKSIHTIILTKETKMRIALRQKKIFNQLMVRQLSVTDTINLILSQPRTARQIFLTTYNNKERKIMRKKAVPMIRSDATEATDTNHNNMKSFSSYRIYKILATLNPSGNFTIH